MCRNLMCQILYFWLSSSFFFLFFLSPPSPLLFAHPFLVSYFWKMEHQKREKLVNDQYTLLYLVYLYYVGTKIAKDDQITKRNMADQWTSFSGPSNTIIKCKIFFIKNIEIKNKFHQILPPITFDEIDPFCIECRPSFAPLPHVVQKHLVRQCIKISGSKCFDA